VNKIGVTQIDKIIEEGEPTISDQLTTPPKKNWQTTRANQQIYFERKKKQQK